MFSQAYKSKLGLLIQQPLSLTPKITKRITMAAEAISAKRNSSQVQHFTLILKNGRLLKHQTSLSLAQFRSDARLAGYEVERN